MIITIQRKLGGPSKGIAVVWIAIASVLSVTSMTSFAWGNPSSRKPDSPLATHGTIAEAKELADRLYGVYQKNEKAALEWFDRQDNPARLPFRQMANTSVELFTANRDAKRLRLMGEPAGVELETMVQMLSTKVRQLVFRYRASQPGSVQVQKNLLDLRRSKPRNDKELDRINAAIDGNQLESAEKRLEKMGRDLHKQICILSPTETKPFYDKFAATIGKLDSKLTPIRRKQYLDQAQGVAAAQLNLANEFASEAKRVPAEIAAKGKVSVEGEDDLDAPAAIRYLCEQWGKASVALIRSNAIQWAFLRSEASSINQKTLPRVSQLEKIAKNAIVGVVDAAAVATPAEEVPAIYSELLLQLSYVDRRMYGARISEDCQPALQRLAAKSDGFPATIAAYQRAVDQPLAWRSRFARRKSDSLRINYSNASAALNGEYQVEQPARPKMYGGGGGKKRLLITKTFAGSASWKVADAAPFFIGRRVSEEDSLRLYEGSLTAIVRFTGVHYSNVAVGMPIKRELDDLKICMVVSDEHAPLSINAANAISSAQSQDFLDVGGAIRQLHLEAAVTRFITLPGIANQISGLGVLPQIQDQIPPIDQACWRLDIEPHWVHHPYFTVAIRSKLPKPKSP